MGHARPARLALTYAVIAAAWISLSDGLLLLLGPNADTLVGYSFIKGIAFVLVTSIVLFLLVNRFMRTLEQRDRDYRDLFEHNPNPMWFYDLDTLAFLRVNDAAVAKYGYSPEEFSRMTIADIRPPEDLERMRANVDAVRSGLADAANESGGWQHVAKSGRTIWVDVTSHATDFEGHSAEVVLVRDLTEARAAREELFQLQRKHLELTDRTRWPEADASD